MAETMRRVYKMRLRATAKQHVAIDACLADHCDLYNAALEERREAWKRAKVSVQFKDQAAQLPFIRAVDPRIARWGAGSEQETLRRLDRAFRAFFRRLKVGQKPGYPRFRSKARFDSVTWPQKGNGCRWDPGVSMVYFKGIGTLKVKQHRPVEGIVKTITLKREGRRLFLVLSCAEVPMKPLSETGAVVGLDLGVTTFVATSDGELVEPPRYGRRSAKRLARAQQILARKKRGSKNRGRAKAVVANRHRKVANQRRDFHHKLARRLVNDHDVIVVEDLRVGNMARSASGTLEQPGTNVAAKRGLNRSILDAGWAQFRQFITDKAAEAGRMVIVVDPRHTSQTCARCGYIDRGNRDGTVFDCLACGHLVHADINAARNILRAGLALLAARAA